MANIQRRVTMVSSLALAAAGLPVAAQAQAQAESTQTAEAPSSGVEEIVVTAQRRSERLQDVPVAVTALTATTLDNQGITGTNELAASVPALDFTRQANGATIYLRGVGNPNGAIGQESSVAMYVDGVYLPSPVGALFSFNNIERIEVLKGPQGTLFGRNATGGVIQIITKDPSQTARAEGSITYANYDTIEGSLYATTGITDNLATDISLYGYDRSDGWGRYVVLGKDAFTAKEWAVRNKWLWTPGDSTEVRLAFDAGQTKGLEGLGWHPLKGTRNVDGTSSPGFYDTYDDFPTGSNDKYKGASLSVRQDLGFADLVSISAYRDVKGFYSIDQDAAPIVVLDNYVYERGKTFSQEVQLLSNNDGGIQWILGGYYFRDRSKFNPVRLTGPGIAPLPVLDIYANQKTVSYAAFAQVTAPLGEDTNVTGGLRWTKDSRDIVGRQEAGAFGVLNTGSGDASFSKLTWRISLDHNFTPDVMAYVSYNRGFKAGLFNLVAYNDPAVEPEVLDAYEVGLKTELLDRRLRLNFAGFYYDYKDLQIAIVVPGGQRTLNAASARLWGFDIDFNAKPSDALTLQGGLNYTHSKYTDFPDGPIIIPQPGGGALPTTGDLKGNRLVHAPKFSANIGGNYHIPTGSSSVDLAANLSYNSGYFWYPDNIARQPKTTLLNASATWNAPSDRWGVKLWGKNLLREKYFSFVSTSAFGYHGSPAEPRTYGVTLNFKFGG